MHFRTIRHIAGILAGAGVLILPVYGESPVLIGISLKAGARGCALVLEADRVIGVSYKTRDRGRNSSLQIEIADAVYGLNEYSFRNLPTDGLVSLIACAEANGGVLMDVDLRRRLQRPVRAKQGENSVSFLLSSDAFPDLNWKANSGRMPTAKPPPSPNGMKTARTPPARGPAGLTNIHLLRRGNVVRLLIELDRPVKIQTRRKGDAVVAVLENTTSRLPGNSYALPQGCAFPFVGIKEIARGGEHYVGVTIRSTAAVPLVYPLVDRLVLYAVVADEPGLTVWSARDGKTLDAAFANVRGGAVDYDRMSKRAEQDVGASPSKASTFEVHARTQASSGAGSQRTEDGVGIAGRSGSVRLIVTHDRVNFRREPSAGTPDNILQQLAIGAAGTLMDRNGAWRRIKIDRGLVGWVHASMAAESSLVTAADWMRINAARGPVAEEAEPLRLAGQESGASGGLDKSTTREGPGEPSRPSHAPAHPRESLVAYSIFGRDPFMPLHDSVLTQTDLPDVEHLTIVGIMYDDADRIALFEDPVHREKVHVLRENDPVEKGKLLRIERESVIFLISEMGISRTHTLKLKTAVQ